MSSVPSFAPSPPSPLSPRSGEKGGVRDEGISPVGEAVAPPVSGAPPFSPERGERGLGGEGANEGINRLAIVGVGLIGGSIGLAAKAKGAAQHVVGVEANADTWADALRIGAVDEITNDLAAGVRGADLVILAVPVGAILELLQRLPSLIGADTVVTDVGSVKTAIAEAGFAALGERFVPGHPMAGSEKGGVKNARADLFEAAPWAITPMPQTGKEAQGMVIGFVSALGANLFGLRPVDHDGSVAWTSHLPHVLAYTLNAVRAKNRRIVLALAAGSWKSATRVAESSPELWTEIALQNAAPLATALRAFSDELLAVAAALETGDTQTIRERFAAGHAAKIRE